MLTLNEVIIVEGLHDKIKLEQIVDTTIMSTDGFAIYKDKQKVALMKKLAQARGIIILTDSDSAGMRIRTYLKNCLEGLPVKHAYIPQIRGKERRKPKAGKEGILGVEGMDKEVLEKALIRAGCSVSNGCGRQMLTKADLFEAGLTGGSDSRQRRKALMSKLELPHNLSSNALIEVLNALFTYNEARKLINYDL